MGARRGEGKNRRSPPPPTLENPNFDCYLAAFLLPFPQLEAFLLRLYSLCRVSGACPGIRMRGGGGLNLKAFVLLFNFSGGAQLR